VCVVAAPSRGSATTMAGWTVTGVAAVGLSFASASNLELRYLNT
jgi:hypothetical protein